MKIMLAKLNHADGTNRSYAAVVRAEDGGYNIEDIVILGQTPSEAGSALAQLLTQMEAEEAAAVTT